MSDEPTPVVDIEPTMPPMTIYFDGPQPWWVWMLRRARYHKTRILFRLRKSWHHE